MVLALDGGHILISIRPNRCESKYLSIFSSTIRNFRDWHTFDFDKDVTFADEKIGFMSAADYDLTKFKAHGGKLADVHRLGRPGCCSSGHHQIL